MKHIYTCGFFPGFYESTLYNSDSEYYASEVLSENGESYELKDFEGFKNAVGREAAKILYESLSLECYDIIKDVKFNSINSPRFYNFETDKLILKVKLNKRGLLRWIKEYKTDFNSYLKENYTSRDGFWSFIENNFNDFMQQYESEGRVGRCVDVMLDFYFSTQFDKYESNPFEYELTEAADSLLFEYMEPTENSKNEK